MFLTDQNKRLGQECQDNEDIRFLLHGSVQKIVIRRAQTSDGYGSRLCFEIESCVAQSGLELAVCS